MWPTNKYINYFSLVLNCTPNKSQLTTLLLFSPWLMVSRSKTVHFRQIETFFKIEKIELNYSFVYFYNQLLASQSVGATDMTMELVLLAIGIVEAKNMEWDI